MAQQLIETEPGRYTDDHLHTHWENPNKKDPTNCCIQQQSSAAAYGHSPEKKMSDIATITFISTLKMNMKWGGGGNQNAL